MILNKTMRHTILWGLLALFAATACKRSAPEKEVKEGFRLSDKMLSTMKTAGVVRLPMRAEMTFFGKITTDANKLVEVFPVVGGNVTRVYVELGDYVEKGQLLATIQSTEVAGYAKELEDARSEELLARNKLKVAQEMYSGKLSTEREVLEARSELEKAQSQKRRVSETYKIYNIRGGSTFEVRAPISGFVVEKNINQDMLLRNDRSDNIFDIAQIAEVWALANVNESDINQVRIGMDAAVTTLSYPDKTFSGKVDKIFNVINPETKAMQVRVKLPNPGFLLKPEMRARIRLSYEEPSQQALAVPAKAVIFDQAKTYVMVYHNRTNIETREVEVLREIGDISYIRSGVRDNDTVITENQLLIYQALNG